MQNNEEYNMAKQRSFGESLLIAFAVIGGLFLFSDYLKRHTLKKVYYRCPECGIRIVENENPCHNCKTKLKW